MDTTKTAVEASPDSDPSRALPALPATRLLIDEPPLQVLPSLAVALGLNEAIFVQQLHYWLRHAPHWRDGRPWVYNSYPQWRRQFPFWDERTIKRIVLGLEGAGIVAATQRYNASPTDRTKWYTLNYGHPTFADTRPSAGSGPPWGQIVPMDGETGKPTGPGCPHGRDNLTPWSGSSVPMMGPGCPDLKQRLLTKSTTEITQQQQTMPPSADASAAQPDDDVVVKPPRLVQLLTERGVTAGVARRLVANHPPAAVARQVAHYDHERVADLADPRLTPGRLRRRIEGDWAPPPGFVPGAERERQAGEEEREHAEARAAHAAEDDRRRRERAATLAAVGATAADQAAWHVVVGSPTPLPMLFREALFRAPYKGTGPVIILRTPEECDRATGDGYARERRELECRLRERFPAYARSVLVGRVGACYAAYDECAAAFARSGSEADSTVDDERSAIRCHVLPNTI